MGEKVREVQKRVMDFWNKYDTKQKTIIISVVAAAVIALVILTAVVSKPVYVDLRTCETVSETAEVKELLEAEGIEYQIKSDNLTVQVEKSKATDAALVLGSNNIPTEGYGIDDALNGGFSTTESDKQKKYKLYTEEDIAKVLEGMEVVKSASVKMYIPEDDGTIISKKQDTSVSVMLETNGEVDSETAGMMARFLQTAVGNGSTEKITIMDTNGKMIYSGADATTVTGNASTQLSVKAQAENLVKSEVQQAILSTNMYDNVQVSPNLILDFNESNETQHEYYAPDGRTEGMITHQDNYESETTNGTAGIPGTDSNDDTTYVIQDGEGNTSTITDNSTDYSPNEKITNTVQTPGAIQYDESSVSVVLTKHVIYREEDLEEQGLLDGTTFEKYQQDNSQPTVTEVDDSFYSIVASATGISEGNITIVAYDVPMFVEKDTSAKSVMDYMNIILIVLILGLLGFVVYRSTRPVEITEMEPELSVDQLLQDTRENLEEIDFDDRSESRKMIEKFVDEKPDAVAQLLRNWLNEEWE
ncbi:MAG: flagellar biosynthesis protein [Lachnospiraceae bacterium]|nr:flagellar biosynthesis protein [Lachnospiraceae bacterium]